MINTFITGTGGGEPSRCSWPATPSAASTRDCLRRIGSGATAAVAAVGGVHHDTHLLNGLARVLLLLGAPGRHLAAWLRFSAGQRGGLGQDLLMAIFLASSCLGSGMRISRTPSL